ncbi:MAG: ATPase, T2SS/T4P/T4SS family [Clostridia bacterium]
MENAAKITLAPNQQEAVMEALSEGVLVITGGPGTGKTTIINTLLDILEGMDEEVLLAAPTGRAAKRMTESDGAGGVHHSPAVGNSIYAGGGRAKANLSAQ